MRLSSTALVSRRKEKKVKKRKKKMRMKTAMIW